MNRRMSGNGTFWRTWPLATALMAMLCACVPSTPSPRNSPATSQSTGPRDIVPQVIREPRWQAQTVSPTARTIAASTYTVQPGESLGIIANRTGAGVAAIAAANGIAPPYLIHPGQRLTIPAGRYHEVRRGETGIAIARSYGVDWSRVASLNALEEPYILRTGQRLLLPSDTEVSSMSRAERAAAFSIDIDDIITGGEPALAANERPVAPVATPRPALPDNAAVRSPANFAGRFGWPVSGRVLAPFGAGGEGFRNNGIDIAADRGTPVLASADGVVLYAGTEIQVHGGLVLISHGDGWITAYGQMEELQVTRGQQVERGQMIARSGLSGAADRPLLHFEIRHNRQPVDPVRQLPTLG